MALIEPQLKLELDEGEVELHRARRHWVVLLQRSFVFVLVGGLASALAFYRGIGGSFIESNVAPEGQLDFINVLLAALIATLALFWLRPRSRNPKQYKKLTRDVGFVLVIGVLALAFYFRFQGGRVFYIDPFRANPRDTLNITLILLALGMLAILIYMVIDWANDYLILTNVRVIYDDQQLLVRHVQQQMLIADIQQVNVRPENYLQHWLNYGRITIRSFSPRTLVFNRAADPKAMQDKIQAEVSKINRLREPELLRRMIEDQIYGNNVPKPPASPIHVVEQPGPLFGLFSPNPEINHASDTVIWRPYWLYTAGMMLKPISIAALVIVAFSMLNRLGLLPAEWVLGLGLLALLIGLGRAWWIYLEHEHDIYIVNRQNIIDTDKKPFGPESRRQASLGAIQDISYDVGFIENLLGYGDVIIKTGGAAGGDFTFAHVPNPRVVQMTINDYLTDFRKREKEQQLKDALALLKQYHILQGEHGELLDSQHISQVIENRVSEYLSANGGSHTAHEGTTELLAPTNPNIRTVVRNELMQLLRGRRYRP